MKHNIQITLVLVLFFVLSQLVGLFVIQQDIRLMMVDGELQITHGDTVVGERPDIEGFSSFMYLVFAIAFGTLLFLLIIKLKRFGLALWKLWFFSAVWITCAITLGVFLQETLALTLGFLIALLKIFKKNIITHNVTEIIMYSGIALLLVPILNVFWMSMILLLISIYDMYAVWKSKHMVKMANFQTKADVFAGFFIPYKEDSSGSIKAVKHAEVKAAKKIKSISGKKKEISRTNKKDDGTRTAILGGGDITFPLLFAGVVLEDIIVRYGLSIADAFLRTILIVITSAIALFLLFIYSKKNRFYPAMPFLSAGCFAGYLLVYISTLII